MPLRRPLRHLRHDVVAYLALFVALGGTSAYAANTIGTADIIDDQVTSPDVRDDTLGFGGLAHQDLGPGSVRGSEIQNFSIGNGELITGSVDGRAVTDGSLTGADIDESSLAPTTTATFVGADTSVVVRDTFTRIASRVLPAGSYAIAATANLGSGILGLPRADVDRDTQCELRNGGNFIGGALDRRRTHQDQETKISLSMNGGANVAAGGGEVSLWCKGQNSSLRVEYGQMMIVRIDGFF